MSIPAGVGRIKREAMRRRKPLIGVRVHAKGLVGGRWQIRKDASRRDQKMEGRALASPTPTRAGSLEVRLEVMSQLITLKSPIVK